MPTWTTEILQTSDFYIRLVFYPLKANIYSDYPILIPPLYVREGGMVEDRNRYLLSLVHMSPDQGIVLKELDSRNHAQKASVERIIF